MSQVLKASTIINHLRAFGRMAPMEREPVSVNDVLKSTIDLMQEQLRLKNIDLTATLSSSNPFVLGNRIQLEQVFLNLLTNARDAVDSRPRKSIILRSDVCGETIEVVFHDSGTGISADNLGRIFDPFFTTKGVGEGTGLGLSISYGIIKEHQGQIAVHSQAGDGAMFNITLPLLKLGAEATKELDAFIHTNR
jgi:C4-dicarboxylate-specific signal transduction histidine kinase